MKNRLLLPDIAKGLCVLYIVAFWHMLDYMEPVAWKESLAPVTNGVLATFTFFSGLFLGKKKCGFRDFYRSRIRRFMPLLFVAVVCFCYIRFIGIKTGVFIICGLSNFIPPYPLTLWYFGMMIAFYLITPVLLYRLDLGNKKAKMMFLLRASAFLALFICLHLFFPTDIRLIMYYPYYILGMICPVNVIENKKAMAALFMVGAISILLFGGGGGTMTRTV